MIAHVVGIKEEVAPLEAAARRCAEPEVAKKGKKEEAAAARRSCPPAEKGKKK